MCEWKEYKLGDLVSIKYGKDHKLLQDGKYPVFGSGGIMRHVDSYLYNDESILIPRKGSLNNIFYQDSAFWTVDTMFWSEIDKERVFAKFLYYQLTLVDFENLNVGSAVPSLTIPIINDIDVRLPSLKEQKQIASILSSLDDKIDLLNRENVTLEAMAETLFRQWFIVKAKEDWEEGIIADLIEFNPSRKLSKGTVAPFLEMSNLSTSTYAPTYWYDRALSSGTKFKNGDTLLARITPCLENGKTAYVDFLRDNQIGWGSTEFVVMHSKTKLHSFFSYIVAKCQDFRDYAESCLAGSSGRQRVDVDNLKNYPIPIPNDDAINQFNNAIEIFVQKMQVNNKQIRALSLQRDMLLPKLMSNEIAI